MENTSPENISPSENTQKQVLPNSSAVLVLGILSIASCWCYGFLGVIFGVLSLILAGKGKKIFDENPSLYTESSYKNLNAGKVCAIIGLCISGIIVLIGLIYILIAGVAIGTVLSTMPWEEIFDNF
jgi:M penetrans paralogue family 26